jgi:hypothetical protein
MNNPRTKAMLKNIMCSVFKHVNDVLVEFCVIVLFVIAIVEFKLVDVVLLFEYELNYSSLMQLNVVEIKRKVGITNKELATKKITDKMRESSCQVLLSPSPYPFSSSLYTSLSL